MAGTCNNAAWSLIEQIELDAIELAQLVTLAGTARHHWHTIGDEGKIAHADLLFGWALARAGAGKAAIQVAGDALSFFEKPDTKLWEQAFAHAAMAAAYGSNDDRALFRRHFLRAEELGLQLSGADAKHFKAAFRAVARLPAKA